MVMGKVILPDKGVAQVCNVWSLYSTEHNKALVYDEDF